MAGLQAQASSQSAVDFLIATLNAAPGEVTVLALAACTNIALAMQQDEQLHTKWKELVILGGAFRVHGNVNPAAEANIIGDPEAADYVVSKGSNIWMIGLDVTHSCTLSGDALRSLQGACAPHLCSGFATQSTRCLSGVIAKASSAGTQALTLQ
jgi:uridine nucleosidase